MFPSYVFSFALSTSLCMYVHPTSRKSPRMGIFFIFRTISQAFASHLKCVSHGNDRAFNVYSDVLSKKLSGAVEFTKGKYVDDQTAFFAVSIFCFLSCTRSRSPPRPSPGSLHYSDEDVSTKYNDLIPAESSSLTEKPSEISDSQVSTGPGLQPTSSPCVESSMNPD